jgi:hypothetical protein
LLWRMKTRAAGATMVISRIGILFGNLTCHVATTQAMFRAQYGGFTCSNLAAGVCLAKRKW